MIKTVLSIVILLLLFGAYNPVAAQAKQVSLNSHKADVKFLDDISVDIASSPTTAEPGGGSKTIKPEVQAIAQKNIVNSSRPDIETAQKLQFKYALLLNTEVEMVQNTTLYKVIDEWFGTRYRMGGTTKTGIDCSALMQIFFTALYGVALPRTAREQFNLSRKISRTELKEGDLVFFNTTGGVSHVGMYLQNNKFIHASSGGVTISDLFDDYWMRRFKGVGRIEDIQPSAVLISKL